MASLENCKSIWIVNFCIAQTLLYVAFAEPQVPCFYIFGDSMSDPGNNNLLNTKAKANYPPYGVDFPTGQPTGRFCNGRLVVDVLAELLGFDNYIKPFTTAKGQDILQGVNYASGAAGILKKTGKTEGGRFSLNMQLSNHGTTVGRIQTLLGSKAAAGEHLSKCLYYVSIGANDYVNNYFMPNYYNSSITYSPDEYATMLISRYFATLRSLYKYGARKIVMISLGNIGYTPVENTTFKANARKLNHAVKIFNDKLRQLVDDLNDHSPGAKFSYINHNVAAAVPPVPAFTNWWGPCCALGTGDPFTCEAGDRNICSGRKDYVYFDNIHPTEAVNVFLAGRYFDANTTSSPPGAYPYNIHDLVRSDNAEKFLLTM